MNLDELATNPVFDKRAPGNVLLVAAGGIGSTPITDDATQRAVLKAYLLGQQDAYTQLTSTIYAHSNNLFLSRLKV